MTKTPQPGQVKPSGGQHQMPVNQMRKHLAQHVSHLNVTKDYGGHGTGFSSQGGLSGSSSGADYETTSVGSTPDSDSAGPTGY
jgi:hypothetical protein